MDDYSPMPPEDIDSPGSSSTGGPIIQAKTPTGDALREWLLSFEPKPEAIAPETDNDPTANTKMVT